MKLFLLSLIALNIFALNLCTTVPSIYKAYTQELELEREAYSELLRNRKFEEHQAEIEAYFLVVSEAFSIGNTLDENRRLKQRDYEQEEALKASYYQALQALQKPREYIQSLYYTDLSDAIDQDNEAYVKFLVIKGPVILDTNSSLKQKVLIYSTSHKNLAETSAIRYLQDEKKLNKMMKSPKNNLVF